MRFCRSPSGLPGLAGGRTGANLLHVHPPILRVALVALASVALAAAQPIQTIPQVSLPNLNTLPRPPSRVPIYYPPAPPPPGGEIDPLPSLLEPNWDPPEALRDYVGELFYPVVGSRLAERDLSRRQRSRLDAYVAKRSALVAALRAALDGKAALPPDHAEAVRRLETEGDELRHDLIDENHAWGYYRQWWVGPTQLEKDENLVRVREFHVLRANAFYYGGELSIEQRWLLWDYVLQIAEVGAAVKVEVPPVRPGGLVRFLPAGARIRLPRSLPDDVRAALESFVAAKTALQRDLTETVIRLDGADRGGRKEGYEALAQRQQAPLADLERQAESIRAALGALPAEEPIMLPEPLATQAREYRHSRETLQAGLAAALREARGRVLRYRAGSEALMWDSNFKSGAMVPVTSLGPGTNLVAVVVETPPQRARAARAREHLDKARQAHQQATAARREDVAQAGERLFLAALATFSPETPTDQPIPADLANKLLTVLALNEAAERMDRYETYVAATSHPGLTPAQRRLLFGAALRNLSLPLPSGIRRPINDMSAP